MSEGPTYYDHLYLSYGDLLRPGVRLGLGWNRGAPPPLLRGLLTDRLATTDHLFDPACSGGTRSDVRLAATATPRVQAVTAWVPGGARGLFDQGRILVLRMARLGASTSTHTYHARCCSWRSRRKAPAFSSGRRPRSAAVLSAVVASHTLY